MTKRTRPPGRCARPEDLLAAVPCVLGFQPEDSVVHADLRGAARPSTRASTCPRRRRPGRRRRVADAARPVRNGVGRGSLFVLYTDDERLARPLRTSICTGSAAPRLRGGRRAPCRRPALVPLVDGHAAGPRARPYDVGAAPVAGAGRLRRARSSSRSRRRARGVARTRRRAVGRGRRGAAGGASGPRRRGLSGDGAAGRRAGCPASCAGRRGRAPARAMTSWPGSWSRSATSSVRDVAWAPDAASRRAARTSPCGPTWCGGRPRSWSPRLRPARRSPPGSPATVPWPGARSTGVGGRAGLRPGRLRRRALGQAIAAERVGPLGPECRAGRGLTPFARLTPNHPRRGASSAVTLGFRSWVKRSRHRSSPGPTGPATARRCAAASTCSRGCCASRPSTPTTR